MRVAVISDVHSNLHALEAVRREIELEQPDEVWNLGDSVGYGARPSECCEALASFTSLSLVGNHDLAAIGRLSLDGFSAAAAAAASWTQEQLEESAASYFADLEPSSRLPGCELYHGSPREPVWAYVLKSADAATAFSLSSAPLVLVGHSHYALVASLVEEKLGFNLAPGGTVVDLSTGRWLLNPGSVGQPRDGDPRSAYLLLDLDAGRAEFKRVGYEIKRTQKEIRAAGLPEQLASRLARGL
ncbi:MAG TPA: metallophosphoesterase family protein [Gaiellaceae bacterium]|jgi:predicted phosphodiesterase